MESVLLLNHPQLKNLILKTMDRWSDCHSSKNETLLRLSLLKDLLYQLRQEKSVCLASGLKKQAEEIKKIESKIESLRELNLNEENFQHVLEKPTLSVRKKKLVPENLFSVLNREEILRFDRAWDATLLAEGFSKNWNLWTLQTTMQISTLPEWRKHFSEHLWPHGIILFSKAIVQTDILPEHHLPSSDYFLSQWFFLLHSQFSHPLDLSPQLLKWDGILKTSPTPPFWKLLYLGQRGT